MIDNIDSNDIDSPDETFEPQQSENEDELETPISIISVGPDRKQTIFRENI